MRRGGQPRAELPVLTPDIAFCCSSLTGGVLDEGAAERIARVFRALGDRHRVRLLSLIAAAEGGEACVCELTGPLGLSQPTVSHHMKQLVEAGLVAREQRGKWAYYRVVPETITALGDILHTTVLQARLRGDLGDQVFDELLDLVPDGADGVDALAGGSVSFQSRYRLPGKTGQASPQPMVMHTSEAWTASVVRIFGVWAEMSMPTSRIASTTAGLTVSAGADPAERTSTRSPARWDSHAAAIWDRPALWTQTKSTEGFMG